MFLSNDESGIKLNEFIKPLATNSWTAIIMFMVAGTVMLSLIIRLQPYANRANDYGLSFVLVIASFAQQGILKKKIE